MDAKRWIRHKFYEFYLLHLSDTQLKNINIYNLPLEVASILSRGKCMAKHPEYDISKIEVIGKSHMSRYWFTKKAPKEYILSHLDLDWDLNQIIDMLDLDTAIKKLENYKFVKWGKTEFLNKLLSKISLSDLPKSLIKRFIDYISASKYITEEFIMANLDLKFKFKILSRNPNFKFSLQFFKDTQNKRWDMTHLSRRLPFSFLNEIHWLCCGGAISKRNDLTIDIIKQYPRLPWDFERLSSNLCISLNDIFSHPELKWDYSFVCFREDLTAEIVLSHSHYLNIYKVLKYIPPKEAIKLIDHFDYDLVCKAFSKKCNFDYELFTRVPEVDWSRKHMILQFKNEELLQPQILDMIKHIKPIYFTGKPDLDPRFIMIFPDKDWHRFPSMEKFKFKDISYLGPEIVSRMYNYNSIPIDFILSSPDLTIWSRGNLANHPGVTFKHLLKYPGLFKFSLTHSLQKRIYLRYYYRYYKCRLYCQLEF